MNAGDKIIVVEVAEGFEEEYAIGDVFEVHGFFDEDEDIIIATNGMEFYDWEVKLVEPPKDYEELSLYDELIESLSQVPEGKVRTTRLDGDGFGSPSGWLFTGGEHGKNTPGKRAPEHIVEDAEWDAMEPVGKEIIYDDYNTDSVEHPAHYTQGGVEVIDIIAQTVSGYDDGFTAHCVGTATKYLNRAPHKHETPLEDLKKAAKYLEFAIKHEEKKRI